MTALEGEPTTTGPRGREGADGSPGGRAPRSSSGRRALASVALGVAILATGGVAVGYLVTTPGAPTTPGPTTPAAAPPPAAAPAGPAPTPQPTPQPAPVPAGAPVVTDTSGAPLPGPVAAGVASVSANLAAGNVDALRPSYVPSRTVPAAPWPTVAGLLANPTNRAALLAALRIPPTRAPDGWRYTSPTGNQVGIDLQGHIGFVRLS